jgi:hypothetical protein
VSAGAVGQRCDRERGDRIEPDCGEPQAAESLYPEPADQPADQHADPELLGEEPDHVHEAVIR